MSAIEAPRRFHRRLRSGIVIRSTAAEHAEQLEELQRLVFPTLAVDQRFKAAHYRKHVELFPPGQFCAVDPETGGRVVGMTSSVRMDFDPSHPHHTFDEIIQGGWLTSHDPAGAWLYGADVGAHPEYRGRGIARALYAARHRTVRHLGLRGQVTVGMLSGYDDVRDRMSLEDYYEHLLAGDVVDPTISMQIHIGFAPRALVRGYLDDPVCDNSGVLLVLDADDDVPFEST